MLTIETTAHVGADGILRVKLPSAIKDKDVRVTLLVEPEPRRAKRGATEKPSPRSTKPKGKCCGMVSPPDGAWNPVAYEPLDLPGPRASEMLVNDRR